MPDQVIVTHAGVEIRLAVDEGRFWCNLDGRVSKSKSLEEIKTRIDNAARAKARATAADVRVTVFVDGAGSYWRGWETGDDESHWVTGTFAGVNAHSRRVTIKLPNGTEKEVQAGSGTHFFLATDTAAIARVKELLKERAAAYRAAKAADEKLDRTLGDRAHQFQVAEGRGHTHTERAALAEQRLLVALGIVTTKEGG